ncbi:DedA family protein [Allohahella sp. A8]|uniref:DedA family protein n=1 Tax=Allohahella sp. A8 TaxID=3141461 RepID=UPI003A8062C6
MDSITELYGLISSYINPRTIVAAGYLILILVVFAETGLAIGFFLPGDSLLVVAGLYAATGDLNVYILLSSLFAAAVVGDAVGYYSGWHLGPKIFSRQQSRMFHPEFLQRAQVFYEKYGGKTIIIARFIPIIRTFAPIVAGAARMPYRTFLVYNVVGGFLWVFSMILSGYILGSIIPNLDHYIEYIVIVVIALSITPPLYEYFKARRKLAIRV